MNRPALLIVLAGLPGVGKSTLAAALSQRIEAVHLRIDTIEQSLRQSACWHGEMDDSGYRIAAGIAADNLATGQRVIADAVNAVAAARRSWRTLAQHCRCSLIEIEIHCSDAREHRRRVEARLTGSSSVSQPDWDAVRQRRFEPWPEPHHRLDTAGRPLSDSLETLIGLLSAPPGQREN